MKLDQLLLVMLVGVMLMNTSNAVPDTCECANEVKTPEICTPTRRTDSASVTEFAIGVEKMIDEVIRKKHNVQHLDEKMNKTLDNGAKVTKKRFREFVARVLEDGPIIVDDEVLSNMDEKKAKINEASEKMAKGLGLITSNMDNFIKLVAKDTDGFERAEIATMLLSEIAGLLPSPVGQGAAALFGLISSVMSASKPSTDKYKLLKKEILDGVSELLDAEQLREIRATVDKIKYLDEILAKVDDLSSDAKYDAFVLVGGLDLAVQPLAYLMDKIHDERDENTLESGRRALQVAYHYAQLAGQRDRFWLALTTKLKASNGKAGSVSTLFEIAMTVSREKYDGLYFYHSNNWFNEASKKKYFSALLVYNMPTKTDVKYAAGVHKFLNSIRTDPFNVQNNVKLPSLKPLPVAKDMNKMFISSLYKMGISTGSAEWYHYGIFIKRYTTEIWRARFNPIYTTGDSEEAFMKFKFIHTSAKGKRDNTYKLQSTKHWNGEKYKAEKIVDGARYVDCRDDNPNQSTQSSLPHERLCNVDGQRLSQASEITVFKVGERNGNPLVMFGPKYNFDQHLFGTAVQSRNRGSTYSLNEAIKLNKDNTDNGLPDHGFTGKAATKYIGTFIWELTATRKKKEFSYRLV